MKILKKFAEWLSIRIAKTPGQMVLLGILFANIIFFSIAAIIISKLAPSNLENNDFWSCVFYTITMILDAGCIQYVIQDIGQASAALVLICITTIILGMIIFTGAVIGYMANWISQFIENANSGSRKLKVSDHIIILNWNSRASEIINDLLYKDSKENIIVLAGNNTEEIIKEINERLGDTIEKEKIDLYENCASFSFFKRRQYIKKNRIKNKLTVLVRKGDVYSTKQLNDISIKAAKCVIILGSDISNSICKYDVKDRSLKMDKGNSATIKTLVQVAQLTASADSANNQQIIVEVEDDWTLSIINKIIEHKMRKGKCNIVPVAINKILGQIFSQFSIMPELNMVYATLFSNKGAAFFVKPDISLSKPETEFIADYMNHNFNSVPLTVMPDTDGKSIFYFMADNSNHIHASSNAKWNKDFHVSINADYEMHDKNIVILGHNSKCSSIMEGFNSFRGEWQKYGRPEVLNVIVIDDEESLEKQDNYRQYQYVKKIVKADIFDKELICNAIDEFIASNKGDTSILVLSDDTVANDEIDANVLTYLIYIQEIRNMQLAKNPDFDINSIDVIVEILNPKNYDVARNYSIDNIVISNRYISKMVTQISEKEALFDFYSDILTFDEEDADVYVSKELYVKKVSEFFLEVPSPCTAADLIRAVYNLSPEHNKSIVLGYVRDSINMILFDGDQTKINVSLRGDDKIILYSTH